MDFNALKKYVGKELFVSKERDGYAVRTKEGEMVISSTDPDCPEWKIKPHVGHSVVCAYYGNNDEIFNISIECEDCYEVLFDIDA